MEREFQTCGESSLLMIFSQLLNKMFSYTPMLMPINIAINIHKQNKITLHKFNTSIQHMREGEWLGGEQWTKWLCFAKQKLKIHVRQFKSMTCPKICLQILFERLSITILLVWKPMAHSLSSTLGSSMQGDLES